VVLTAVGWFAPQWVNAQTVELTTGPSVVNAEHVFKPFGFWTDPRFSSVERASLIVVLCIAFAGLIYAVMLVGQVKSADQGTKKMQEIADAVREGANAYLWAQFKKIGPLIIVITVILYLTTQSPNE
jgi:K(+)-stimulated pyrophosphate-energized sodium pump